MIRALSCLALAAAALPAAASGTYRDFADPPHDYWNRTPRDRISKVRRALEAGQIPLDRSSEKAFVVSLLKALDVPVSSQLLVYSTTSLQLSRISLRNPRALYFTDDVYIGWVPRGQIEVAALDPDLGTVFYIFDVPRGEQPLVLDRANRCMNCHGGADSGYVPGLVVESVLPGPNGGGLKSWRNERTGHDIPFQERFGGWFVTGSHPIEGHKGNQTGELFRGNLTTETIPFGSTFPVDRYPVPTSDIAAHLFHEHQAGFVNRTVAATYRARSALHRDGGSPSPESARELDEAARELVRYMLFADEVPIPSPGIEGNAEFLADFQRNRRPDSHGRSLRDPDLKTRLLRYRCSYMIYSPVFEGLPDIMKSRVLDLLAAELDPEDGCAWIPAEEKEAIQSILTATLPGFPRRS